MGKSNKHLTPTQILIRILFRRERGICFYCEHEVHLWPRKYLTDEYLNKPLAVKHFAATIDHIIPKSRKGANTPENTLLACAGCNFERGVIPAVDFIYIKRKQIQNDKSTSTGKNV